MKRHGLSGFADALGLFWLRLGMRMKTSFYLYLAFLFTFVIITDSLLFNFTAGMKQKSFDWMMKRRLIVPKPDPDIVIVDINEASLAAMSKEYGRWPWPRQVMAEFLEAVGQQKPKAVVFDILFSDPDVFNQESDAYFDEVISKTDNTFFPMLRLDPASDSLSEIGPEQIPGIRPVAGQAEKGRKIAVVLPFFRAAIEGGRLGIHNIYPDEDGVVRSYVVFRHDYGWLVPSLPARIVEWLNINLPDRESVLLNWRGGPFTYKSVSFADVFMDMTAKERKRPQDEFKDKIVIIGSTAAGLFDIKPTPMSRLHPGVEILATAIDNLKRGDYLRVPDPRLYNFVLSLLIVWATGLAFYKNIGRERLDRLFGASQSLLLVISYASINLMTTYINLTGPVTIGIAYFSIARIYSYSAGKALEKGAVISSLSLAGDFFGVLLLIRCGREAGPSAIKRTEKVRKGLRTIGRMPRGIETLKAGQKGIWGLFEGMIAVSWMVGATDEEAKKNVMKEIGDISEAAAILWEKYGGDRQALSFIIQEGAVCGGSRAGEDWRRLFGQALMKSEAMEGAEK